MHYLRLPWMDDSVSVFDIAQAHLQLECDYNRGGWLRERPSNLRRMESTGVQLHRMGYDGKHRWVDIYHPDSEDEDEYDNDAVRDVYIFNVLKLGLPISDPRERDFILKRYCADFLDQFPNMTEGAP